MVKDRQLDKESVVKNNIGFFPQNPSVLSELGKSKNTSHITFVLFQSEASNQKCSPNRYVKLLNQIILFMGRIGKKVLKIKLEIN